MKINNLILESFRNYATLELSFDESRNIIVGENAQGKTNLAEAVYMAAFARSFRTNNAAEMISFGKNAGRISADVTSEELEHNISISIRSDGKKMIKKDGKIVRRTADLLNTVVVIVFTPDDLRIIKDSPEKRRTFLNRELSQMRPGYYEKLKRYNDVVREKNALLKNLGSFDNSGRYNEDLLDVYDRQLADSGYELIRYRKEFTDMLSEEAADIMRNISDGREELEVRYKTSCDFVTASGGRDILYSQIRHNRDRDMYTGSASLGPHRDDLEFYINGSDARKYGSQGQQRTVALSLKLAEIRIAKQMLGEAPVLLLDDVLSELDPGRQSFLVSEIDDVQLFITSAELSSEVLGSLRGGTLFRIEDGTVTRVDKY